MADVARHPHSPNVARNRGGAGEYEASLSACPAPGCACPIASTRDGRIRRQCAAAGEPGWSVGRPVEVEPQRRMPKSAVWSGESRGAVTLTLFLTKDEAAEFERFARECTGGLPEQSSLADAVRHAAPEEAERSRAAAASASPAAPSGGSSMKARVQKAEEVRKVADARLAQLRVADEARRQMLADKKLIPVDVFEGMALGVANELRRMTDRQRRRVEAIAPMAGEAVEEEWLATAPRIVALLRCVDPGEPPA